MGSGGGYERGKGSPQQSYRGGLMGTGPHTLLSSLQPSPQLHSWGSDLSWDYFVSACLSVVSILGGIIGSCSLSVEFCNQGHGPFPKREGKGRTRARHCQQAHRPALGREPSLPLAFLSLIQTVGSQRSHGFPPLLFFTPSPLGCSFSFWSLSFPTTPREP